MLFYENIYHLDLYDVKEFLVFKSLLPEDFLNH